MKKLLVFMKEFKIQAILAPLFKLLEASFELIVPLVVADIIDNGIKTGDKNLVLKQCAILVLLGVIGLVSSITAQYFSARAAVGFSTKLRRAIFRNIQSLSFTELDRFGVSSFITALSSDVNMVQNGVNMTLRLLLRSPFIVFGALIMAMTINFEIALIFAICIILLSVIEFVIIKSTIPKYKEIQETLEEDLNITKENLEGARVIRSFVNEKNEVEKFNQINSRLAEKQKKVGAISALNNPLTYVVVNLAIIAVVYSGGIKVNSGVLQTGQVVALYNYMSQILVELLKLAALIITVTKSFASSERLVKILDLKSSLIRTNNKAVNSNYAVEFDNVSFAYEGDEMAVSNISFSVNRGEVVGIIGSTGSGKSTIAYLIEHFYDASKGVVSVFGRNVNSYNDPELHSVISIAMQKAVLFYGTVRENLLWGNKKATDKELVQALKIAEIYETIEEKGGLDFVIEAEGRNLSGGQRQRLTIARTIASNANILIFDDSFSALDFVTEKKIRNAVYNLKNKPTVFIISQRTASIMSANRILVMDDGELVGNSNHNELLNTCSVYNEIYSSQFKKEGE